MPQKVCLAFSKASENLSSDPMRVRYKKCSKGWCDQENPRLIGGAPEGVHSQRGVSPAASSPTAAAGEGQDGHPGGLSWTIQSSLPCGKCGLKWFSTVL